MITMQYWRACGHIAHTIIGESNFVAASFMAYDASSWAAYPIKMAGTLRARHLKKLTAKYAHLVGEAVCDFDIARLSSAAVKRSLTRPLKHKYICWLRAPIACSTLAAKYFTMNNGSPACGPSIAIGLKLRSAERDMAGSFHLNRNISAFSQ